MALGVSNILPRSTHLFCYGDSQVPLLCTVREATRKSLASESRQAAMALGVTNVHPRSTIFLCYGDSQVSLPCTVRKATRRSLASESRQACRGLRSNSCTS